MAKLNLVDSDTGAFTSFAGADAIVTFEGAHVANIQSITVNTTRETVPIYVLGSADAISFNKNKRAIAGSMVMVNFDRDMLVDTLKNRAMNLKYRQRVQNGLVMPAGNVTRGYTTQTEYGQYLEDIVGMTSEQLGSFFKLKSSISEFQALVQQQLNNDPSSRGFRNVPVTYADQLPPFDISVCFANADGATAHLNIRSCIIMNTGFGISIDDAVSEKAVTFVARRLEPLRPGLQDEGQAFFSDPAPSPSAATLFTDAFGTTPALLSQYTSGVISGINVSDVSNTLENW